MTRRRASEAVIAVHTRTGAHRWAVPTNALPLDETPGSPWVLVPPLVRRAFDAVARAGVPLAETIFGPPLLGVKCGCNEAFLVTLDDGDGADAEIAQVRAPDGGGPIRHGVIERVLLRPVVRGETLAPWCSAPGNRPSAGRRRSRRAALGGEWIVWTHGEDAASPSAPLASLPPRAMEWLAPWRHRLAARSDTRGRSPWWALFRTESANPTFSRVVWADLGQAPRAAVLAAGDRTVALNSCYVARASDAADAHALATLLNSAVAAAWLNALAEPARGGFRRYLGWTVGLLPLPRQWTHARDALATASQRATAGEPPSGAALTTLVADAYGLAVADLAPLLSWSDS